MKFSQQAIAANVLVGLSLAISCARHEPQPVYNGRPLREWCKDFYNYQPPKVRSNAKQAICQIGTNALPFLMNEMRTLGKLWRQKGAIKFNSSEELTDRVLDLRKAFEALGPIAKPAVPELVYLLNSATSGANGAAAYALTQIDPQVAVVALTQALTNKYIGARCSAAVELYEVRSNADIAVPNLIICLKDKTLEPSSTMLRAISADTLGVIHAHPETAVPALIEALKDKELSVRIESARALGQFGNAALSAVLPLQQATNDSEHFVREVAALSLQQIQTNSP